MITGKSDRQPDPLLFKKCSCGSPGLSCLVLLFRIYFVCRTVSYIRYFCAYCWAL